MPNNLYKTQVEQTAEQVKQALAAGWGGSNAYNLLNAYVNEIDKIVNKQDVKELSSSELATISAFKDYILERKDVTENLNSLNSFLKTISVQGVSLNAKKDYLGVIKALLDLSEQNETYNVKLSVCEKEKADTASSKAEEEKTSSLNDIDYAQKDNEAIQIGLADDVDKADADKASESKADAVAVSFDVAVELAKDNSVCDDKDEGANALKAKVGELLENLQPTAEQAKKFVSLLDNQKVFAEYLKLCQMVDAAKAELKDKTVLNERSDQLKDGSIVIAETYSAADASKIDDSAKADFVKLDKSTAIISKLFSGLTLAMVDAVINVNMINIARPVPKAQLDTIIERVGKDADHKEKITSLRSKWETTAASAASTEGEDSSSEKDKDAFAGRFAIVDQLSGLEGAVAKFKAFANSVNDYVDYLKKERTTFVDRVTTYFDGKRASSSVYRAFAFSAIAAGAAYFAAAAAISGALYTVSIAAAAFGVGRALSIANVAYNGKVSFNEVSPLAIDGWMAKYEVLASVAPLAVSILAPFALPAQTAAAAIGYTGSIAMRAVYSAVASIVSFATESFNLDLPTFVNKTHFINQVKATDAQLNQAVTAKAFESFKTSVANVEVQENSEDETINVLKSFKENLAGTSSKDVDVAYFKRIAALSSKSNKDILGKSDQVIVFTQSFLDRLTSAAHSKLAQDEANKFNATSMGSKFGFPVAAQ